MTSITKSITEIASVPSVWDINTSSLRSLHDSTFASIVATQEIFLEAKTSWHNTVNKQNTAANNLNIFISFLSPGPL
jgi:hypothetical protein